MESINIDNIIENIYATVESHRLDGEGRYARWLWQSEGNGRELGINEYGCADAANILYTIGKFPNTSEKREAWIKALQDFQNPQTGLFKEPTHHFIHTTAHCVAALELFDAKPLYPMTELKKYADKEGLYNLLENLDWENAPWPQSHQGAGIYASMVLTDSVDDKWEEDYFAWLWDNADPETGLWKKGAVKEGNAPVYHSMGGGFHYLFNLEYKHMPLRYPEKMIDTCIELYENHQIGSNFAKAINFIELDWVYCITRASRQTPHRFDDCRRVLKHFTKVYIEFLNSIDVKTHDMFNDLHMLFGAVCCLAELQQALPGLLKTKKPLKLVLDRRPFV